MAVPTTGSWLIAMISVFLSISKVSLVAIVSYKPTSARSSKLHPQEMYVGSLEEESDTVRAALVDEGLQ